MALDAVGVSIDRRGDVLSLRYMIEGDVERVRWPEPAAPARADELWQHSCFEAFVQPVGRSGYVELNLSPSGRWASYAFDGRREGMRDALVVPVTAWAMPVLTATADLREIGGADWRIGLTMVVEAIDGTKSFWALTHAPGPPDFHNPDCFIATLPAPDGP
ncbi:MAG: DOMON-like domain-containing protein [Sphingomonas sp.]|uniref:DOMON-like domain-containing protein n=1 Tax=Sphingomonas sp. TaxID=28214 RepID=UPI001AC4377E|nr:DOMON-like domain-containing protein [Sphingomonas sp.]MBN8807236.1 DOMON-like domain-containing protein [Sphingomonas sp.]